MRTPHTVFPNRPLRRIARAVIVLAITAALTGFYRGPGRVTSGSTTPETTVPLQTTTVPMLSGTFQTVNDGPGDQTDPHADCDRMSYTNDDNQGVQLIHYFDFATNTDHVVSGNGLNSLPDVYGGVITFTEGNLSGPIVVLFDTATQTRTVIPGFNNSHSKLGGNLVAFENRSFSPDPNQSEISVYDRTTGVVSRLTNDALFDKNAAVSPTGNTIVWEKCQTTGLGCDIYAATQTSPGVFITQPLAVGDSEERNPKTNGDIVVYVSNQSGENDIYVQPLTGGPANHLAIPGDQRDLSLAGNLLSFESLPPGTTQYDLYVYDLSTANLYRVTDTPVNEVLNSLTICNGVARVVYASPGMDFNVYSFTFQIPSSTEDAIDDLIALIESFNLPKGTENSLVTKLQDALTAVEGSDTATACICLSSFINECQAQSGKKLTADQATQLINSANQIKTSLGCQ